MSELQRSDLIVDVAPSEARGRLTDFGAKLRKRVGWVVGVALVIGALEVMAATVAGAATVVRGLHALIGFIGLSWLL